MPNPAHLLDAALAGARGGIGLARREHRAAHDAGPRLRDYATPRIVAAAIDCTKALLAAALLAVGQPVKAANLDAHGSGAALALGRVRVERPLRHMLHEPPFHGDRRRRRQ